MCLHRRPDSFRHLGDVHVGRQLKLIQFPIGLESRHEQARRMQEIVLTDLVHIHLCQPLWFHGVRDNVKGVYAAFTNFYPSLRTAWLDT